MTKPVATRSSILLATYEMPWHLELVLTGLARQSCQDFEIILCDDGSGSETALVVEKFKKSTQIPLIHVWHEHQGFRKCKILNEGIRRSQGDWLIFLDGDCVPHFNFVEDHLRESQVGYYLAGRRVELGQKFSSALTPQKIEDGFLDRPTLAFAKSVFEKDSEHFQRSLRFKSNRLRRILKLDRVDDLKGCNFSVSRKDLDAINGFDEDYEGYGREDTDVEIRLQNLGLKIKSLKGLALQYHIWHPRREFTPKNDARLEELKRSGRVACTRGIHVTSSV